MWLCFSRLSLLKQVLFISSERNMFSPFTASPVWMKWREKRKMAFKGATNHFTAKLKAWKKNKQFHIRQGVEKSVSHTHKHRCVLAMLALLIAAQDSTGSSQVFKFLKSLQKKLVCNGHTLREERPIMAFHWLYLAFICELNGCTWRWEFSSHSSIWL